MMIITIVLVIITNNHNSVNTTNHRHNNNTIVYDSIHIVYIYIYIVYVYMILEGSPSCYICTHNLTIIMYMSFFEWYPVRRCPFLGPPPRPSQLRLAGREVWKTSNAKPHERTTSFDSCETIFFWLGRRNTSSCLRMWFGPQQLKAMGSIGYGVVWGSGVPGMLEIPPGLIFTCWF